MLYGNRGFMLSDTHFGFKIDTEFLYLISIARLSLQVYFNIFTMKK